MIGDKNWVHHRDPENKRQPMEYCHTGSPAPKEFKTKASAGRVMLTVFWNYEGLALTVFLVKVATLKSKRYIETLQCLKKFVRKKGAEIDDFLLQQGNFRPCEA